MTESTCTRSLLPLALVCLFFTASPAHSATHVCITAQSYGYDYQEFSVTTEDGYILQLQRIPRGRKVFGARNESIHKEPFLLQHGILMVYWAWTWVESAKFDHTANVSFVYKLTGQKVNYIAHSLGTFTALTAFSQHKLVDKVKAAALLSPIAYISHMTTIVHLIAEFYGDEVISMMGILEFIPRSTAVDALLRTICSFPGLSSRDLVSIITVVRSGKLSVYDYRNDYANLKNYGVMEPPAVNLSNIPADLPLFLGHGGMDAISDVEDVGRLIDELKLYHQEGKLSWPFSEDYTHADFVVTMNGNERIHRPLIEFFNSNDHSN